MAQLWDKFKDALLGADIEDDEEYDEYEDYNDKISVSSANFARGRESRQRGSAGGPYLIRNTESQANRSEEIIKRRMQIKLCFPKDLEDSRSIVVNTRNDIVSIVDLFGTDATTAQRIADFLSGAVDALDGEILRLNKDMFLTAPEWVDISNPEIAKELKSNGINFAAFNWS